MLVLLNITTNTSIKKLERSKQKYTNNTKIINVNKVHQQHYNNKCKQRCLHSYIFGHYNPSVRIIELVSNTAYVVCINFIVTFLSFKNV